ncbi:hypothetical protein IAR55_003597 [Kwoniella newhampshirensis]|uniref:Uncharacterized protein n=1 Tax=Kwoniella newhampshirensis TaxID=1651941 RepID=A0AAW0YZ34_9TREE
MTPRLPSRGYTNVVELGFLLPWAARASSGSSRSPLYSSQAKTQPSNHRNDAVSSSSSSVYQSETAASSSRTPRPPSRARLRPPLLPPSYRKSPRPDILQDVPPFSSSAPTSIVNEPSSSPTSISFQPRSKSLIHETLLHPNPPPASALFLTLRAHPSHFTLSSGSLLAEYARRTGDMRTEREIYRLMNQRRISPLGRRLSIPNSSSLSSKGKQKMDDEEIDPLSAYSSPSDKNAGKKKYKSVKRPNRWAIKDLPPLDKLTSTRYTTEELLRHLHYLILEGDAPDFGDALGLLDTTTDNDQARTTSGAGLDGKKVGYAGLRMLHLYLAYLSRLSPSDEIAGDVTVQLDPLDLLSTYQAHWSQPPNRQTLHLFILSILSSSRPPTRATTRLSSPSNETLFSSEPTPADCKQQTELLVATISLFRQYRLPPGPETWRHVALHALQHDLPLLCQIAWEGWFASIRLEQERDDGGLMGDKNETKAEVRIRFRRIGTMNKRWRRVVHMLEEKGWVKNMRSVGEGAAGRRLWGYSWVGESVIESDQQSISQSKEEGKHPWTRNEMEESAEAVKDHSSQEESSLGRPSMSDTRIPNPIPARFDQPRPNYDDIRFISPETTSGSAYTTTYDDPTVSEPILARAVG